MKNGGFYNKSVQKYKKKMKPLNIRNTGLSVLDILELFGRGYDIKSILAKYPEISEEDIKNISQTAYDYILEKMILDKIAEFERNFEKSNKDTVPDFNSNTHFPNIWSKDNEQELSSLYKNGAELSEISRIFQCSKKIIENKISELKLKKD